MELNWNFLGGGGIQNKKPSMEAVWIFFGTVQCCANIDSSKLQVHDVSSLLGHFTTLSFLGFKH